MSEQGTASLQSSTNSDGNSGPAASDTAYLLALRKKMKSKEPEFRRFESWRYVRIHEEWRKPKGVDNHTRLSVKGWPPLVRIGYRGPRKVRGLHPSGYRDILVTSASQLEGLSSNTDAIRLSGNLGLKKRIEIAKRAKELKIRVLNGRGLLTTPHFKQKEEGEKPSQKNTKKGSK